MNQMTPIDQTSAQPLTMKSIATEVAERHGLTLADLKGADRTRRISRARQEAMFDLRALGSWSLPQIGAFLGDRDHSTVSLGIDRHVERLIAAGGDNAEGRAFRIANKINAEMRDSPGWLRLTNAEQARLSETAALIGAKLA